MRFETRYTPNMLAARLAPHADSNDERLMPTQQPKSVTRFENDATEVLSRIKATLSQMIIGLSVYRPVDLKRLLELDATLSWQLFKIMSEKNVLASGAAIPSRASLQKFAAAAVAKGVSVDLATALSDAYEQFEAVVERHAGDRTTFISLTTSASAAGVNDDWLSADLQHRRHAFRAFSHAMGVQAQTRVVCQILGDGQVRSAKGHRFAFLSGHVNVRTLRQIDRVRVYGSMIVTQVDDPDTELVHRWPLGRTNGGVLISDFCSQPLPELIIQSGTHERHQWADIAMISPEVGKLGEKTVMFGEEFLSPTVPDRCNQKTNIPCESLLIDLLAPAGRLDGEPTVEQFLGDRTPLTHSPDSMPLVGNPAVVKLGQGPEVLQTPEVPRYVEMVRAAAARTGFAIDEYDVWRLRIEYPYYHSTAGMVWKTRSQSHIEQQRPGKRKRLKPQVGINASGERAR